jgi:hypothetical protein
MRPLRIFAATISLIDIFAVIAGKYPLVVFQGENFVPDHESLALGRYLVLSLASVRFSYVLYPSAGTVLACAALHSLEVALGASLLLSAPHGLWSNGISLSAVAQKPEYAVILAIIAVQPIVYAAAFWRHFKLQRFEKYLGYKRD